MRRNLLARLGRKERILPGIIGYDDTVIPDIENAVLAGHHMVFLGERGQAKSRIIRGLTTLLDPLVPAVEGCPINDSPFDPICRTCRRRLALEGDALPVAWVGPEERYGEKLATPDVSMADLIGEIDPVKVAEGRYLPDEIAIMEQEVPVLDRGAREVRVPFFVKEIVAQLTFEARGSNEINQSSGVSVRVTINNYESLLSNAEKRAVRTGEREIVPRLSDLPSVLASMAGKIELEYVGEDKKDGDLIDRLINRAVIKVWDKYLKVEALKKVTEHFEAGWGVEVSDQMGSEEYLEGTRHIPGLREGVALLGAFESPALMATAIEFVLEGLHLHQKLNKDRAGGRYAYRA